MSECACSPVTPITSSRTCRTSPSNPRWRFEVRIEGVGTPGTNAGTSGRREPLEPTHQDASQHGSVARGLLLCPASLHVTQR